MSPEAQRVAIAEACGWKFESRRAIRPDGSITTDFPLINQLFHVPDYPNDLNAMHEAWKRLSYSQKATYFDAMLLIVQVDGVVDPYTMIHVTAAQRAEAFLRTLNLWDDSK